jgi:hypothetical protein
MKKSKSETTRRSGNARARASRAERTEQKSRTHFVPRVVFRTAFAGVVPVCVAASGSGCGGRVANSTAMGVGMAAFGPDACPPGYGCAIVGGSAFTQTSTQTYVPAVATTAFSTQTSTSSLGVGTFAFTQTSTSSLTVACACFAPDSSVDSAADGGLDGDATQGSSSDAGSDSSLVDAGIDGSFGDAGLDANAPDGVDDGSD